MNLSIVSASNGVTLLIRAEGPGGMLGDASFDVHAGQVFEGVPEEILSRHLGETVTLASLQAEAEAVTRPPR